MIKELIEQELIAEAEAEYKKYKRIIRGVPHFYFSDVLDCTKRIALQFYYKRPETLEQRLDRQSGRVHHEYIQNRLVRHGYQKDRYVIIPRGNYVIAGKVDAFKDDHVVEIKTFKTLKYVKDGYKEFHEWQLQLGIYALRARFGSLLYVSRSSFEMREWIIPFKKELVEKILLWFDELYEMIIEKQNFWNIQPDETKNWRCKKCEYQEICHKTSFVYKPIQLARGD